MATAVFQAVGSQVAVSALNSVLTYPLRYMEVMEILDLPTEGTNKFSGVTLRTGAAVVRALIRAPLRIAILAGAKAVLKLDGHTGDEAAQSVGDAVGSDGIWWVRGLAGAAAGMAAQALVAVPVENIRIRMLMADSVYVPYDSWVGAAGELVEDEGYVGLWKGMSARLSREFIINMLLAHASHTYLGKCSPAVHATAEFVGEEWLARSLLLFLFRCATDMATHPLAVYSVRRQGGQMPNHNMASGVAAVSTDAMGSPFVGVRWVPAIHAFSLAIKVVLQAFGEAVATEVRR